MYTMVPQLLLIRNLQFGPQEKNSKNFNKWMKKQSNLKERSKKHAFWKPNQRKILQVFITDSFIVMHGFFITICGVNFLKSPHVTKKNTSFLKTIFLLI